MPNPQEILETLQKNFRENVRAQGYAQRIAKLRKLEKWIIANRKEIQQAMWSDFHKPPQEVDSLEIHTVLAEIRHCARHLYDWMQPKYVPPPLFLITTKSRILTEPKGVVLILAPWNFPFMLAMGPLVSAIAAGNCVVVKPSEHAPATSAVIGKLVEEVFDPNEVVYTHGDVELSETLVRLPFDHIFFTGSPFVGKLVMKAAAETLTPVTLELGGRNPAIVDETADLKDAATKLMIGKFANSGQSCVSPNYIYVHQSVFDKFLKEAKKAVVKFYGEGEQLKQNKDYTHVVDHRHWARVRSILVDAIAKGAKLLHGGEGVEGEQFFGPTLLGDVPPDARARQEEIFGPVASLIPYTKLDAVLDEIHHAEKPLSLYIFSRNQSNINTVIGNTHSGAVGINETSIHFLHPGLPFGGVGFSGIGKAHGYAGFLTFSNERPVMQNKRGLNAVSAILPPYTKLTDRVLDFLVKYL